MSIRDEARAKYVRRSIGPSVGTIGDRLALAWEAGSEWQASREPTDAEVEAAMHFLAHFRYAPWWGGSEFRGEAHALLSALRARADNIETGEDAR